MQRFRAAHVAGWLSLCILGAASAHAATIYVDWRNTSPTTNGTSWGTAWTTIGQGTTDLLAKNTAVKGGHTLLIATGEYTVVDADITLSPAYSGTNGAPNTIQAVGNVGIDGVNYNWYLLGTGVGEANEVRYIILDGFHSHDSAYGINVYRAVSNIVRNCRMTRGNMAYSGMAVGYYSQVTIENCSIYGNGAGISLDRSRNDTIIKNCIIAGNAFGLTRNYENATYSGTAILTYSCFFGNGINYRDIVSGTNYNTETEINTVPGWSANIVRNPGFASLANNWNFSALYDNSPCLNAGQGGVTMGAYTNPILVATSGNTYYVDPAGSDTNSKAAATNPATPWKTITNAAANAVAGDTVIVQPGTYSESVSITNGGSHSKPVVFRAATPGTVTNASSGTYSFDLTRVSGVTLDGFYILMTGNGSGGVRLTGCIDCTLTNLEATQNGTTKTGLRFDTSHVNRVAKCSLHHSSEAAYLYGSCGNAFSDCRIFNTGYGAYNYNYGAYFNTFLRCLIYNNSSTYPGWGISANTCYSITFGGNSPSAVIINCNIFNNKKGVYANTCSALVLNSDIVSNSEAGVYHNYSGGTYSSVTNCIISTNGVGIWEGGAGNNPVYSSYNCFFNNQTNHLQSNTVPWSSQAQLNAITGCSNNIVANPLFVNASTNNYRLNAGSPCIGAGRAAELTSDLYGNPRPRHAIWDIGSFQWWPPKGTIFSTR